MAKQVKETASVLAFERKLDISDAVFYQTDSADPQAAEQPVTLREKSIRGTISNRLKNAVANDPAKLDAEIQKANLQTVDVATLHEHCDTLIARFTLKVLPFTGKPNVCNNRAYQERVLQSVADYLQTQGLHTLALRYAANIANARWLWRNRIGAEHIAITVRHGKENSRIDNAKALSLNDFANQPEAVKQIATWIEQGLKGETFILLEIEARAKVGYGQEVYPSQELILDDNKNNKKSKVLYEVNGKTGLHSQKIGNALRTIDTWYGENVAFPIAAEPYGAVTTLGEAFRQPRQKNDFYTLFDNWVLNGHTPDTEQQHYVMSILIRGGVFGASGKE